MRQFLTSLFILFAVALTLVDSAKAEVADDPRADEIVVYDQDAFKEALLDQNILWIEDARAEALAILKGALQTANMQGLTERIEQMTKTERALSRAKITAPKPGTNFFFCEREEGMLAYVNALNLGAIKLCDSISSSPPNIKYLAQILIHEGAHTARYFSECKATEIELVGMKLSGAGVQFVNGYWEQCGITRNSP
jgi:hypothetical protein